MDYHSLYAQKLCSPEEAVRIVKDGDWVDYSETCSYPQALDAALAARSGELQDVKIRSAISMIPIATVENDPHGSFTYNLWHCSALDRKYVDQGRAYHLPMLFRHNGTYYRKGYAPVNVAMVTVAPMDENGNFSFGLTNCTQQEVLDAAEHIVVEVNPIFRSPRSRAPWQRIPIAGLLRSSSPMSPAAARCSWGSAASPTPSAA